MKYICIPENSVDFETRKAAHHALASARKELRLPMVEIKWFMDSPSAVACEQTSTDSFSYDSGDLLGAFRKDSPRSIYIRTGQPCEVTKNTVYHETFHLWEYRNASCLDASLSEEFAYGYSADIAKRLEIFGEDEDTFFEHLAGKDWSEPTEPAQPKPPSDESRRKELFADTTPICVRKTHDRYTHNYDGKKCVAGYIIQQK